MRRFLFPVLFLAAGPALAEPPKITIDQVVPMASALRNLDGRMVVVKQNGTDNVVVQPWDFGDARVRLRIATDLAIVDAVVKTVEDARQSIFREVSKKAGVTELKVGTPERAEFDRQVDDLMAQPAPGSQGLARIKASELKLDRNEIAGSVLSALRPILDDDVTGR